MRVLVYRSVGANLSSVRSAPLVAGPRLLAPFPLRPPADQPDVRAAGRLETGHSGRWNALDPGFNAVPEGPVRLERGADGIGVNQSPVREADGAWPCHELSRIFPLTVLP